MSEHEAVRGLPEPLPAGEELLWQGAPRWGALIRRAFFLWPVVGYFGLLMGWILLSGTLHGDDMARIVSALAWQAMLATIVLAILTLLGWLFAKTTVYTITSRRIVMRFGLAVPLMINLPFNKIEHAALKTYTDGSGDIPLTMATSEKISYYLLWPNIKPWVLSRPQPMLRCIPEAESVAQILARALEAAMDRQDKETQPDTAVEPGGDVENDAKSDAESDVKNQAHTPALSDDEQQI